MTTSRKEEMDKMHAPHPKGEKTRLQVMPDGPNLQETIDGQFRTLKAGTVFLHPAPARVKWLLELVPPPVRPTNLPTAEEAAQAQAEDEVAVDLVADEIRAKAKKVVEARKAALAKFEKGLRAMNAETLDAEVEKRKVTPVNGTMDAKVQAILDDELATMKAA